MRQICSGLLLFFLVLLLCTKLYGCEARNQRQWKPEWSPSAMAIKKGRHTSVGGHGDGRSDQSNPPVSSRPPYWGTEHQVPNPATMFSVIDYGANGDGVTDDTKAFEAAWAAACKVEGSVLVVPAEFEFLVGPISFSGPYCRPNIVFQLDGTILAPADSKSWRSGLLWWIEFTKLQGITIRGSGIIEGRGSRWWTSIESNVYPIEYGLSLKLLEIKPTALRFYRSYNVTITGITIQNSPQCHLKFDNCELVQVFNMTINSPGTSLNTDGIHLQNSRDVMIHHTNMSCGDDCVSIQTGCTNINIHNVDCGPGHGISIGGLGRDNMKACVSNVTVRDVNVHNTTNGVRIKTWQVNASAYPTYKGGSGSVQRVTFSNVRVSEVQTPIVIDQFYCDRSSCKNQTSAVALSGIAYENIRGTYTVKPLHFACSDASPCSDISITGIELQPLQEQYHMYEPFCWKAFGELYTPTVPPIVCLQSGKPTSNGILSNHDMC